MTIKNNKINPLNALGIRKTNFPAKHFHFITLEKFNLNYLKLLESWIFNNLNGRFYIGQDLILVDNQYLYAVKIGFEQEKEVSFFRIACPHI